MADNKIITKGCKVEVSSNESGFHGAWYVATLVDIVDKTPIKNNNKNTPNKRFHKNTNKKTGYLVRYDTLYEEEDLDENLCETVDPRFVRPIPPMVVVDGEEFKVDDVIDAYHRDGWWIGVVKKVIYNVEENWRKYLVSFENPPEEVEFEKGLLRFHVDWLHSCWKVPPTINNKKTQEHESSDINATHTAESNNDAQSGFTTPSRAARSTDLVNHGTCRLRSAKKRSRLQQNTESNSETIGEVEGAVTYNFRKTRSRIVNSVEENSCCDRSQASAGGKRKKAVQVQVPVMERSGSQAMHLDSPIVEHEVITAETSDAEEGHSRQRTKKGRPLLLEETSKTGDGQMVQSPNGLQEGNQNANNRDSFAFDEATSESDDLPLSVWCQGLRPHSVLNRSSCRNCNLPDNHDRSSGALMPLSQAIVSNGGTNNEQQVWPFVKQSFFWATIESMELHQKQKPHFSPLKKMKEGCREGYAIGHMVTFENVIRDVLNYHPSNPTEKINNSLELLDELEPHGFDVSAVRGRLNMFLSSKVKVGEFKDELKKFENDIEICNVEKRDVEEELNELGVKIQELQEMMVLKVKMKAVKDQDIKRLQSNVDLVANQITEAELAIKKLAARPL